MWSQILLARRGTLPYTSFYLLLHPHDFVDFMSLKYVIRARLGTTEHFVKWLNIEWDQYDPLPIARDDQA